MDTDIIEFVPLKDYEDEYEILNKYPYTIRKKSNHYIISESKTGSGYPRVSLNRNSINKHTLIAKQFIPNPENLPEVDHINHNREDYHLENLRWTTHINNMKNQISNKGITYEYVDNIPLESIKVDFYDTKTERHNFENYYYHDGIFYYDNDVNYKIIHINTNSINCKTIHIRDTNGKKVNIVVNRFLKQHDLL